ncbi:MAG: helix-turn-helix transcriptional regulator [Hyphomonadaceae bacterium]
MKRERRLSEQTIGVLGALADKPGEWLYGLEIAAATELKSGSLYPILIRLDERGLLESKWLEPEKTGRPPRHAYRITPNGRAALKASLKAPAKAIRMRPSGARA